MRTDRELLTSLGATPEAEDSIRRHIQRTLKKTKGRLTPLERQHLAAIIGHLAEKDASKP